MCECHFDLIESLCFPQKHWHVMQMRLHVRLEWDYFHNGNLIKNENKILIVGKE